MTYVYLSYDSIVKTVPNAGKSLLQTYWLYIFKFDSFQVLRNLCMIESLTFHVSTPTTPRILSLSLSLLLSHILFPALTPPDPPPAL